MTAQTRGLGIALGQMHMRKQQLQDDMLLECHQIRQIVFLQWMLMCHRPSL